MTYNPNLSDLDPPQALRRCINSTNDTLRIELSDATGMAIELSANDGDSVLAVAKQTEGTGTVSSSNGATDIVVAEFDVSQSRELQLFCDVGAGITGSATANIEFSPLAAGNVWLASGVSLTVTGSSTLVSTKVTDIYKRARVKLSANSISVGTGNLYLISRS